MFRTNPKQLVERIARNLYGIKSRVKVTGERPLAENVATFGIARGEYLTRVFIDGVQVAATSDRNWRASYRKLIDALKEAHKQRNAVQPITQS